MSELFNKYKDQLINNNQLAKELYEKHDVKRGLRDSNGKGVMAGITNVSSVRSFDKNGESMPGVLEYRGYNIKDLVEGVKSEDRFGFEEATYLLIFGTLPAQNELDEFKKLLGANRQLPKYFERDIILQNPTEDLMNSISMSLLALANQDTDALNFSLESSFNQAIKIIGMFPAISVYAYQAFNHYIKGEVLSIRRPKAEFSTAENILYMMRPDGKFSDNEAKTLDVALMLHMDHSGGNNSTFTTRVVTSAASDTYATMAAAMASLKGPKHGGANGKAFQMLEHIRDNIKDFKDEDEIRAYLLKILNKEAFDNAGLLYGIGHAVYTLSDPRYEIFKSYVEGIAKEKGLYDEFLLYEKVAELSPSVVAEKRKTFKPVSSNIDYYSGFVYKSLGIPEELYTPLFAIARVVGWCAHRIEDIINGGKIVRPDYESVTPSMGYVALGNR